MVLLGGRLNTEANNRVQRTRHKVSGPLTRDVMQQTMTQTDQEFVKACGFAEDSAEGTAALALRRELGDYGRAIDTHLKNEGICADTKIIDTGILHPTDSIDLIDFTVHIEDLIGVTLTAEDLRPLIAAGQEEMKVRDWICIVLDIRKKKAHA